MVFGSAAGAQGVTTASITGTITEETGRSTDGAEVRVVNLATGVSTTVGVRHGRYFVHGLEVGGPYRVTVRHVGFRPESRDEIFLSLGHELCADFRIASLASTLPVASITADANATFSPSRTGITYTVSDSVMRQLPSARRDLYEFVQLAPFMSTRAGMSGGGVGFRFNSFLIDGTSERALQGNFPAGAGTGKPISMEAVKEYQVLLTPFDVRHGDFAGALVNAVTQSGTNTLHGSGFGYFRNESFARDVPALRGATYDRAQFGFSAGGPLVRNRAHYFVAAEIQRLTAPALGPYVGQSASSAVAVPADTADIMRFVRILDNYGIAGGSAGMVATGVPVANVFGRVDVALPAVHSRLVLRHNFNRVDDRRFARPTGQALFPLSSMSTTNWFQKHATGLQVYTTTNGGVHNEIVAQYFTLPTGFATWAPAPQVVVTVPHATTAGGVAFLQAGSHEFAQGGGLQQRAIEVSDNLTVPLGASHRLTVGARMEQFRMRRDAVPAAYGIWGFASLDALAAGVADSFRVAKAFGPVPTLRGIQSALHLGDQWRASDRLTLTLGVRADFRAIGGAPPYNAVVDSLFSRRTDVAESRRPAWSPRVGFNWDVSGTSRRQLRGGLGIFAGRPPLGWLFNAYEHYGAGLGTLRCGARAPNAGPAPPFTPDFQSPPNACAGAGEFRYAVNLVNGDLGFVKTLRAALGYDWDVAGTTASIEGLYTHNIRDFIFVNRNLGPVTGVARDGRVMYGSIDPGGISHEGVTDSTFSEVVDLEHHARNYSFGGTLRVVRPLSDRGQAWAAYTFSRARDVQGALNPFALDNWRHGRVLSGKHDDRTVGVSDYDQPHRVALAVTYAVGRRWTTDVSFYYVGSSGSPYTYVASLNRGRGDLNADGTAFNDPIYVPRNAFDNAEIQFSGTAAEIANQQTAFEAFIEGTPCLRRQRGRIMTRNSCRSPWVNTTSAAVRQTLPALARHNVSLELDIFNVLNLLNSRWGASRLPSGRTAQPGVPVSNATGLLAHIRQSAAAADAQPVFRFNPALRRYETIATESYYQFQLAVRYNF